MSIESLPADPTVCQSPLATRPLLYTDTLGGKQTMRDDLWAVTTAELNEQERVIASLRAERNELFEFKTWYESR